MSATPLARAPRAHAGTRAVRSGRAVRDARRAGGALAGLVAAGATAAVATAVLGGASAHGGALLVVAGAALVAAALVGLAAVAALRGEIPPRPLLWTAVPACAAALVVVLPAPGWLRVAGPAAGALVAPLVVAQVARDRGDGRWTGGDRAVVAAGLAVVASTVLLVDPFRHLACRLTCTSNAVAVAHVPWAVVVAQLVLAAAALAWCVRTRRDQSATTTLVVGAAGVAWGVVGLRVPLLAGAPPLATVTAVQLAALTVALVPGVVAWWRLVRQRVLLARVAGEATRSHPFDATAWLRDATRDSAVRVLGPTAEVPAGLRATVVTRAGRPVALVAHDPATTARVARALNPLVTAIVANAVRRTDEAARYERLVHARREIVRRSDAARARLERDLHDGAQQRLLLLGMVLAPDEGTDPHDAALRAAAVRAASGALEEVRRLGHGAVPPLLAQMGLVEALRACAEGADVPCSLRVEGPPPLSAEVERAVHRAVATLLDDAGRCGATGVDVWVGPATDGLLAVEVEQDAWSTAVDDDLADRAGAVRGRWERSVRDGRSVGRLEVPCG